MRQELAALGVIDARAAEDPEVFRETAAAALREAGPRIRTLYQDPEVKRLLEDPVVQSLIQSGDTLGLLLHPGFQNLVTRVAKAPTNPPNSVFVP